MYRLYKKYKKIFFLNTTIIIIHELKRGFFRHCLDPEIDSNEF